MDPRILDILERVLEAVLQNCLDNADRATVQDRIASGNPLFRIILKAQVKREIVRELGREAWRTNRDAVQELLNRKLSALDADNLMTAYSD